jgi:cob(I)alamin adenosyltransferase
MPRIYTRTGDRGDTGLCDGSRTTKSDQRVDLYGEVDELNSALGVARAQLAACAACTELQADLLAIQSDLFELGALLADPPRSARLVDAGPAELGIDGAALEPVIDRLEAGLAPLRSFILPGGDLAAAALHLARTVCRRAERKAVAARGDGLAVPGGVLIYLNRLSDLLFVAARRVNHERGVADVIWPGRRGPAAVEP